MALLYMQKTWQSKRHLIAKQIRHTLFQHHMSERILTDKPLALYEIRDPKQKFFFFVAHHLLLTFEEKKTDKEN